MKSKGLSEAAEGLRKVLDLERRRKFADTSVIGGLDRYLLRFAGETQLSPGHAFSRVLQALPPGGYHALHPVQRRRLVDELLKAVEAEPPAANDGDSDRNSEAGRIIEFPSPHLPAPSPASPPKAPAPPRERGREESELVRAADVVVTMGCGDACPVYPGKRYEDWKLDDPAGKSLEEVRPIRDEIERRVKALLAELVTVGV